MKKDFLRHLLYAKNQHSLHSPFAFDFYNSVVKVDKFAIKTNEKIDGLINRIIEKFNFQNNLFFELDTQSNILNQSIPIYNTSYKSNSNFLNYDSEITDELFTDIKEILLKIESLDLACFNLNQISNFFIELFEECISKRTNYSCFIFRDIYCSKQSKEFWYEMKKRDEVKVTFDLYYVGLVFFNSDLSKQNYRLRF